MSDTGGANDAGGQAGAPEQCPGCPGGICLPSGACVACLPSHDECPDGQYCGADNVCAPGCKTGSNCASGVCGEDHDCQSCLSDSECGAPHVCGNNQCAAPCTSAQEGTANGCGAGLTCCGEHCVDAATDSAHCGACGTVCAAGQFCGTSGCRDSTLSGLCSFKKIALVLDGQSGNETPGRAIAEALHTQCVPAPALREVSQLVADVVNADSGRPVSGGDELLIAPGGYFYAHLTDYLSKQAVLPVYSVLNGENLEYRKSATDAVLVSSPRSAPNDNHDFFVIQFARDPSSGSLILNAQGFWQSGTVAAAFYIAQGLLPAVTTFDKAWYLFEWQDANANLAPELSEIVLRDSGN